MATVAPAGAVRPASAAPATDRKVIRDSMLVAVGGQVERAVGMLTALTLRWGLDPARLGVYTGLRLYLDNTNRTSLGVGLGAVQEIPILRAAGRYEEARRVANVAHTTNTLTCLAYAAALLAYAAYQVRMPSAGPLADEWIWGLAAVAGLTLVKRYETFLVAVLRAQGAFALTAELDVVESSASALAVPLGLWAAGFWGLLAAVGALLLIKIAYAHARNPLRFEWAWHTPTAWRLMRVGLPILANTAVFAAVLSADRVLILARLPDGARAAGLYSVALIGTGWALDLAGRLVLVSYNAFQTTLGRSGVPADVARQAVQAAEAQAPILFAGSALAYVAAPALFRVLMPQYADGLPALRPLLPGSVLLGMTWPARQMLITVGHPLRLFMATLAGLACVTCCGVVGADLGGIVGVAWGMTAGYTSVFLFTSFAAAVPELGLSHWMFHTGRLGRTAAWFGFATLVAAHAPLPDGVASQALAARLAILTAWLAPTLWLWGRRNHFGGLFDRASARRG